MSRAPRARSPERPSGVDVPVSRVRLELRRRLRWLGFAGVPAGLALLAIPLGELGAPTMWPKVDAAAWAMATALLASLSVLGAAVLAEALTARGPGRARLARQRLVLTLGARPLALPVKELALAWRVQPRVVEVFTAGGDRLQLEVADDAAAEALVRALRASMAERRTYAVPLETPRAAAVRQALGVSLPLGLAGAALFFGPGALPAIGVAALVALAVSGGAPAAWFGADGVLVALRLERRFVAYRDVAKVARRGLGGRQRVLLWTRDGDHVCVGSGLSRARARLIEALLREGVEMVGHGAAAGAHVTALERAPREERDAAWGTRLAREVAAADYRRAALDEARLLKVLRNPAAEPEQRVGAAWALLALPRGRAHVLAAAEVSTEPAVRRALRELAARVPEDRPR